MPMSESQVDPSFDVATANTRQWDEKLSTDSHFLVCGLGSLGQFCVSVLKEFGVTVSAITTSRPDSWEVANLPDLADTLVFGDCRETSVLEKIKIQNCRAVLLVTSDDRVNIEAAFAVRLLNPSVRVIVRSAKQNLNELLHDGLGNFVALEASQLPAPAFAIAALGSEIRGFLELDGYLLRVAKVPIDQTHRWCDRRVLHALNTPSRRLLSHIPDGQPLPKAFHQWEPDTLVQAGDQVAYIELTEKLADSIPLLTIAPSTKSRSAKRYLGNRSISLRVLQHRLITWWQGTQTRRVASIVGVTMLSLLVLGTFVFKLTNPQISWLVALYTAGVMLLGSYDTVFGALNPQDSFPVWMRLMNLLYMLAGTASIAVLYALLTETLLAAKFQLPKKRPPVPPQNHVVLVGLGRVGRRVAVFLQQLKQPLVGVSNLPLETGILPNLPLLVGEWTSAIHKANLATAKSVVVATDDEMLNLELGLMAHAANPNCALVIRTFDPRFSVSIDRLLPYAKVLCAYDLAAEAFVASAFGENILSLLRLNEQTVLVTEYHLASDDTLSGKLLSEVAYGYGVVPILHQRSPKDAVRLMPSDDVKLEAGDRLVVLATIDSLQLIERGAMLPRQWQVRLEKAMASDAMFDGSTTIARVTGCSMAQARQVMNQLPTTLPILLYKHQAQRLVRELGKVQIRAHLIACNYSRSHN